MTGQGLQPRLQHGLACALAVGRCVTGASGLAAPRLAVRFFLGRQQEDPALLLLARLAGLRDLLLGLATLDALRSGGRSRQLLALGAICDATDGAMTLAARSTVPTPTRRTVAALAWSAAATGAYLSTRPPSPPR